MKQKIDRFLAIIPTPLVALALWALTLVLGFLSGAIAALLNIPSIIAVLCTIIPIIWLYYHIKLAPHRLLTAANRMREIECNPFPMLETTAFLLSKNGIGRTAQRKKILFSINHAVALRDTGEYEQAIEHLRRVPPRPDMPPQVHAIFYNNLADLFHLMGSYEEADAAHEQFLRWEQAITNPNIRQKLDYTLHSAVAAWFYRKEDYQSAKSRLEQIQNGTLASRVDNALLYARACIKLGEYDTAREKLAFVIQNGNRLHAVTEARSLWETLE